jgi:hypothetical protein
MKTALIDRALDETRDSGQPCIFAPDNKKAQIMPVCRYFTLATPALLMVFFVCQASVYDAYFHDGVSLATSAPRMAENMTPATRIKQAFALFVFDARRQRDAERLFARTVKPQA